MTPQDFLPTFSQATPGEAAGPIIRTGRPGLTCTFSVGVAGFEPTASSSRTKRATKLRHTPSVRSNSIRRPRAGKSGIPQTTERPAQREISVRIVASGRQAKRTGAVGCVPTPAETCSQASEPGHRCRPLAIACGRSQLVVSAP